ncbi:MAG TPA: hypothetical protein VK718_11555 [Ferruginibacter sp.]|nr:hypothetical protein [Ferruginibacter sp.]
MKKIFYVTAIITILLSCKKSSTVTSVKWQLLRTNGGVGSITIIPPADSVTLLILNSDSTYQNRINGTVIVQGFYHLVTVQSFFSHTLVPAVQFYPNAPSGTIPSGFSFIKQPQLFILTGSTLEIDDNNADGFVYQYKKVY